MTRFLLIRHAHCDPLGVSIAGRAPGIHLNERGRAEARALASRLSRLDITALYSSPLERTLETAAPIAQEQALEVTTAGGLLEVDFGEWTGKTFSELDQIPQWRSFNSYRSGTRIPGGESMADVLARALPELNRIQDAHSGASSLVALVSHGDVLRMLIAHFLGMSWDLLHRLELSPASVSVVDFEPHHAPRLLLLNSQGEWPEGVKLRPGPRG
jgi:probable phosphomutase (TIGR03848 family)